MKSFVRCLIAAVLVLSLHAQPSRIVSTFPSITETLFALGAGDRVVGVSSYCRYPPAVLTLPRIGTYIKPDAEKIALLRPDLVILQRLASTLPDRLSALGIRYVEVKVGSLADVYSMIRDIGVAVGLPAKADFLNASVRSQLAALSADSQDRHKPTVLMVVGRTPGLLTNLIAVSPSAYLGELLKIAGGANILTDKAIEYPHISLETVVRLNPEVILDFSMMGDTVSDAAIKEASLREPWLTHHELDAVRSGRVFGVTSEILVTPGPRIVQAVDLIRAKLGQKGQP